MEDHPFVVKSRKVATLMKEKAGGGLYLAMDVSGACSDDVDVFFGETELKFLAECVSTKSVVVSPWEASRDFPLHLLF